MLMDHNVPIYEKFEAMLEEKGQCILITATGTGKSYIVAEYLERHNSKALVVCPKKVIINNWKSITDNVNPISYQKLSNIYRLFKDRLEDIAKKYDVFVFDEVHHIGGAVWGEVYKYFKSIVQKVNPNAIFIGITADSKRYFEGGRDVAEEFFDNCIVYGYSQMEAIEKGILPPAEYVVSIFDTEGLYNEYKSKIKGISKTLNGQLDYVFKNTQTIEDIFHRHMPVNNRKGIVFVDKISSIPNAVNLIQTILGEENLFYIHSKLSDKTNFDIIRKFEESAHGYIVTVDMLNEGLHINGINTIIMLRRTESPMIFMQQVGRGLASNAGKLIVFDFVGNSSSLKIRYGNIEIVEVSNNGSIKERKTSNQSIVYDYTRSIINILNDIDCELRDKIWTEEEDEFLRKHYQSEGGIYCADALNRTKAAITNRVLKLGLSYIKKWTDEESKFLINNPNMSIKEIASKLNRPIATVSNHKSKLGLTNKMAPKIEWTEEMDNVIRENIYKSKNWASRCSKILGIESSKIGYRAKILGLSTSQTKWTSDQEEFLIDNISKGAEYCSTKLGFTRMQIYHKCRRLGLEFISTNTSNKPWSEEEINLLKNNCKTLNVNELSELLEDRSAEAIRSKLQKLGLEYKPVKLTSAVWTDEEINILIENYNTLGRIGCQKLLKNKSINSIRNRVLQLGLKIDKNIRSAATKWTDEEINILINEYPKIGESCFDMILTKSTKQCMRKAKTLGLIK